MIQSKRKLSQEIRVSFLNEKINPRKFTFLIESAYLFPSTIEKNMAGWSSGFCLSLASITGPIYEIRKRGFAAPRLQD